VPPVSVPVSEEACAFELEHSCVMCRVKVFRKEVIRLDAEFLDIESGIASSEL
jgi:hypothetical protein